MTENEIGTLVLEEAISIHKELGPGLFESVYEVTLAHALSVRRLPIRRQIPINIVFRGIHFDEGFRADVIVADKVLLEIKSVERLTAVHKKQLQTYLRLTGLKLGYLLNFGEELLKNGIVRCVNGLPE
jgi:GxxExxY protein